MRLDCLNNLTNIPDTFNVDGSQGDTRKTDGGTCCRKHVSSSRLDRYTEALSYDTPRASSELPVFWNWQFEMTMNVVCLKCYWRVSLGRPECPRWTI